MRKVLSIIVLSLFLFVSSEAQAQGPIYLPIITKGDVNMNTPSLVITDGTIRIDILGEGSGWKMAEPYWNPQISQLKNGGTSVNAQLATGSRLVHKEYSNVIETIPLSLSGFDRANAMKTAHDTLGLLRQASDYWAEPYEYDQVWVEFNLGCEGCLTGYGVLQQGQIPELTNPLGQPFFSSYDKAVMENITLIFERKPFWTITKPGEIIGPLYNLLDNPDFELWNFGIANSQPDSWTDLETTHITGTNNQQSTGVKFGQNALKIDVTGSTLSGAAKGVTQIVQDVNDNTEYTIVAWVRSDGVSNGVGRILVNYSSQLELYRDSTANGWTLYTGKITTGVNDTVSINAEILTTSANTVGTFYIDGLMFIQGDWRKEAQDNILPYIGASHIVNHFENSTNNIITAGNLNYVDAWNVPGSTDSLIKLELKNNTTPADTSNTIEVYQTVRIGLRRTNNVTNFDNLIDPQGQANADATNGNAITLPLTSEWKRLTSKLIIGGDDTIDNLGRFRVLARAFDDKVSSDSDYELRLSYYIGNNEANAKFLTAITLPIANEWSIADLTPNVSVNFDRKFQSSPPGQLGYVLDGKIPSANDGLFDYMMIMPTDGGYINMSLSSPLKFGNTVTIDNTSLSSEVNMTINQSNQWILDYTTPDGGLNNNEELPQDFAIFNGELYMAAGGLFANNARILKRNNGVWETVFKPNDSGEMFVALAVYNGELYATQRKFTGASSARNAYKTKDGITWEVAFAQTYSIEDMIAFDGYLWLASGYQNTGFPILQRWDGTIKSTVAGPLASDFEFTSINIYNNKLYLTSRTQSLVYEYDTIVQSLTLSANLGSRPLYTSSVFQDKLYVPQETFYAVFDGNTWTSINYPTGVNFLFAWDSLVFDNELYISGRGSNIQKFDGENWTVLTSSPDRTNAMIGFEGKIFATDEKNETSDVLYLGTQDVTGTQPIYKGTPFLAPPRTRKSEKRHRYFFSYDRENFINNIDDKALIGIGFVPRYFELPARENP